MREAAEDRILSLSLSLSLSLYIYIYIYVVSAQSACPPPCLESWHAQTMACVVCAHVLASASLDSVRVVVVRKC